MKKGLKLSRTLLLCALTLCLLFTSAVGVTVNTPDEESAVIPHENATQVKELIEHREKNSSTYLMSDGTYQFVGYAEDIRYEDEQGKLVEIDCAITSKNIPEGYIFGNTANSWYAYFADNLAKENAVLIKDSGYSVSFGFPNANLDSKSIKTTEMKSGKSLYEKYLAEDNRSVIYRDVFKGVDIAYTTLTSVLKEDIILKNASSTNTFDIKISTEGVWAKEQNDTVIFVDKDGEEIFRLAPLYMVDANEKYSENVKFTLKQSDDDVILTITADENFLTESDTKFPVVLDPTIIVTGTNNTYDSFVSQQSPNSNYFTNQALCTGTNTAYDLRRSFIRFNLPTYISANEVTGASLNLKYSMGSTPSVRVHPVLSGWSSSSVTWNNQPSYNSNQYSNIATHIGNNWYSMNVTTMVKNWLAGQSNYGFALKATSEPSNYSNYTNFYSSDAPSPNKPELIINYVYFGSRPYQQVNSRDVNCMGYALEYYSYVLPGMMRIYENEMIGKTTEQMQSYIANQSEIWMLNVLGSGNFGIIPTYNSDIDSGHFRAVLRVGFVDDNGNGVYNVGEDWDYHWWYQTSTGNWAEKRGQGNSQYREGTISQNPALLIWQASHNSDLYYNSSGEFYKIKDIRTIDW